MFACLTNVGVTGSNHGHLAEVQISLGDAEGALAELAKMQQLFADLTSQDPDNVDWRQDFAVSYGQLGEVRLILRQPEAALEALVEGGRCATPGRRCSARPWRRGRS